MRVRVRGPTGQNTITFDQSTTVADFTQLIKDNTGLNAFEIKYGYPNLQFLRLEEFDPTQKIAEIGVNLNGEQLIINSKQPTEPAVSQPPATSQATPPKLQQTQQPSRVTSEDDTEPPEVPLAEYGGTVVLRIMPDDNSCLFRAVGGAIIGGMDTMTELRSIVAQTIQAQPDVYSDVVLEKKRDDY
ncbi:hypothetical protein F66182_18730, partial [Fusarium sp. NRRL 66182]